MGMRWNPLQDGGGVRQGFQRDVAQWAVMLHFQGGGAEAASAICAEQ
jgi:hypothetical protein